MPPITRAATKNMALPAAPAAVADSKNSTAATISTERRPQRSPNRPAKNAPNAQPNSMDATSNPTPAELDWKACFKPSTVPLMTPLSKPNRKPPMVATQLMRMMKRVFSAPSLSTSVAGASVMPCMNFPSVADAASSLHAVCMVGSVPTPVGAWIFRCDTAARRYRIDVAVAVLNAPDTGLADFRSVPACR